jgi:hypothetical protein
VPDLLEVGAVMEDSSRIVEPEILAPASERPAEEILPEVVTDPNVAERQEQFDRLCEAIRSRSNVLDRAELVAQAKVLHEQAHPEAKRGGAPGKAGGGKTRSPLSGFVILLAQRTLRSRSSIHGDVEIATRVAPDVRDRLRETPLAMQTSVLLGLARLPRKSRHRLQTKLAGEYLQARTTAGDRDAEKGLKAAIAGHRPPVERRAPLPPLLPRTRPIRVAEGEPREFPYEGRVIRVQISSAVKGEARVVIEVAEADAEEA